MNKTLVFAAVAVGGIGLTGCQHFTPRPPIIEDRIQMDDGDIAGTLATAADYRVILVRPGATSDEQKRVMSGSNPEAASSKICAEPPPDVASQQLLELAGKLQQASGLDAEASASISVLSKQLAFRSQGLQLFRDGQFALCVMNMNRIGVNGEEIIKELTKLREQAVQLIALEIEKGLTAPAPVANKGSQADGNAFAER